MLLSQSFQLNVPGASLYVEKLGQGTPLLMLHGGPGADSRYLRPQCDELARLTLQNQPIQLVYYDQRGAERSPLDEGQSAGSYQTHVEDVEQVRLALAQEQLILCGYSWGGLLALLYANQYPHRIKGLILISPAPIDAKARDIMKKNLQEANHRPVVQTLRQEWLANEEQLSAEQKRHYRFALAVAGYFHDPRNALQLTPFRVMQRVEEAIWRSLGDYDLRKSLAALQRIQALIVHGQQDVIPVQSSKELAQGMGASLVLLEACGHVPYIEGHKALLTAIQDFLLKMPS